MRRSELLIQLIILPLDYLAVLFAFVISYELRGRFAETFILPFDEYFVLALGLSAVWIASMWLAGVYRLEMQRKEWDELVSIIIGSLAAMTVTSSVIFFIREVDFSRAVLLVTVLFAFILLIIVRLLRELGQRYLFSKGYGIHRLLIVGQGDTTQIVLEGVKTENDPGITVVGVIASQSFPPEADTQTIDEVILADPYASNDVVTRIINYCEERGIRFRFVPNLFEVPTANVATYNLAGIPVVTLAVTAVEGWYAVFKRIVDFVGALIASLIASPILILAAVAIRIDSDGPVLYRQVRVGKNGKPFELLKFRSMRMLEKDGQLLHSDADTDVEKLKEAQKNYKLANDPRVTRVGHIIRKTSIDELPQLFNVLRGELSLVGPRAYLKKELDSQLEKYPDARGLVRRLATVRPGVTGIWQVSGRSNIEFSERVAMDAYYATHANFILDIKILLQTIPVVLKGTGAM